MAEKYIPYDGTASPGDFQDGAIIDSTHFTNEFDQLGLAFGTGGHNHDGTAGSGPKIGSGGIVTSDTYDMAGLVVDSLTITSGTAVTSIDTDLSAVSATDNTLASAKAIKTYVDAQVTASDLDFQGDSGGALSIDLDSETLTIAGGTGLTTTGSGNTLTVDIDSTVATLTGTQTLTNKTLTSPDINGGTIDNTIIGGTTAVAGSFTTVSTTGNITVGGTVDGRDVATDGTKLDGIETGADVTDATNVQAAGALMDSEVTNLAQVKAFSSADYATAAQGTTADSAVQPADNISVLTNNSGYITGNQTITLSGDATGSGTTAITVALAANTVGVSELNLTDGTAGQFLKTDGAGNISFATAPTQATSFSTIDINGGTIDGVNIGGISPASGVNVGDLRLTSNSLVNNDGTADADLVLKARGPGQVTIQNISTIGGSPAVGLEVVEGDIKITAGGLALTAGNVKPANGYGIDFSATGDGSATMGNELFDDYEEGTWTPVLATTSPSNEFTTATIDVISCTYTKVGKLVTIQALFHTENIVLGTASGLIVVGGLPYVPAGSSYGVCHANSFAGNAPTIAATSSTHSGVVFRTLTSLAGATSQIDADDLTTGASDSNFFRFTITYEV